MDMEDPAGPVPLIFGFFAAGFLARDDCDAVFFLGLARSSSAGESSASSSLESSSSSSGSWFSTSSSSSCAPLLRFGAIVVSGWNFSGARVWRPERRRAAGAGDGVAVFSEVSMRGRRTGGIEDTGK